MSPSPEERSTLEVLTISRPDQLKALGHPLRLRVLEMLGEEAGQAFTNRELAGRIGIDPGHLHFHVRMLLKAGLIQPGQVLADRALPRSHRRCAHRSGPFV